MSIFVGPNNEDMNRNIRLREVNVAQAKLVYPDGDYIDNDIILFEDITKVPLPASASRMKSLFLALCTGGSAQYTVDTKEHKVSAGDVIIISEEQVVADYQLSPDCEGIALIMSYDFFQNIVSGIHELAALFLFAVLILFSTLIMHRQRPWRTMYSASKGRLKILVIVSVVSWL